MGAEQSAPAAPQQGAPAQDLPQSSQPTQPAPARDATPRALVIVGPSGVGKGTLLKHLMSGNDSFGFSVSHTTRQPRPGEQQGVHYYFTNKEQFAKLVGEKKFLEYAEVHNNLYGTTAQAVQEVLDKGKVCVLDIDVQGARQIRQSGLIKAIFVFVAPPSLEDLVTRLAGRGTETREQIDVRLRNAKKEIESLNEPGLYDYLIINDNLEDAVERLRQIAGRALQGLDAEPGQMPERVVLEDAPLPDIPGLALTEQANGNSAAASAPHVPEPLPVSAASVSTSAPTQPPAPAVANATPVVRALASNPIPDGMEKWVGKVALVTGASSGIGWATCEALAAAGMRVVAVARRKEKLEELQKHILSLGISPAFFLPVVADITKDAEVAALPKIVSRKWPEAGIDVLVNNAGMSRSDASLFEGNIASWVEMLSTNILGTAMCTRAVLQDMKRRKSWGHIINMVGLSGHRIPDGPQGGGFYCATKSAVKTLTEGLRQEARGQKVPLRVSGISPGIVETEFFTVRAFGDTETAKRATSQFKCLQPEDIAQAVLWCLSAPEHVEVNDIVVRPTEQLI